MAKEDMEWEIHKLLMHHTERRIRTERRVEAAMFVLLILGMLVYQSGDEAFTVPYIGIQIPRTVLVFAMPLIISAIYNIFISLVVLNMEFSTTTQRNLLRLAESQNIELSGNRKDILRIGAYSFYMTRSMAERKAIGRWATSVTMVFHGLASFLLPLIAIGYFLSQSWGQTSLWIWVITVLMSLSLVTISVILFLKVDIT